MPKIPLYILGGSGHAREIAAYAGAEEVKRPIFFVEPKRTEAGIISVAEYQARMARGEPGESILGSGRCDVRSRMLEEMVPPFATIVHPTAVVLGEIGPGCVIAPNAVVAPHAVLSEHVLVNYNATIGHDAMVGRLCVVGPTAAVGGFCSLDERVYVGAGALIREHLKICTGAIIGMGAVVTKDVPENEIMIGSPAHPMPRHNRKRGWLQYD